MGYKEEMEEFWAEMARKMIAGDKVDDLSSEKAMDDLIAESEKLGLYTLPRGASPFSGTYSEYDGGDETACAHENVREITLLNTVVKECIDCGKELK